MFRHLTSRLAADHALAAKSAARKRALRPDMDNLEERKVLSTVTGGSTAGTLDNVSWVYSYNQTAKSATLTITDAPGSATIGITAMHPNLSQGDPGYDPAHVNDVTGIDLTENDQDGGPSVVVGTKVSVVVKENAGDHPVVNHESSFGFSTQARTTTPVAPPATPPPTTPPPAHVGVQTGTNAGMQWKAYYDQAIGEYRLDINDVGQRGKSVMLMQDGTNTGKVAFLDTSNDSATDGPTFGPNSHVDVRVFTDNAPGAIFGPDANVVGIGTGSGAFMNKFETHARTKQGGIGTQTGTVKVDYVYNCVSNTGVVTVHNVDALGHPETFDHALQTLGRDPGDPAADSPTSDPVKTVQFQSRSQSDDNGGVDVFIEGESDAAITYHLDNSGLKAGHAGHQFPGIS